MLQLQLQVCQGQVALGVVAEEHVLQQLLGLGVLLLPGQLLGLLVILHRPGDVRALGIAGPQGVLIEGQRLVVHAGPHHGAQPAVAQGEGFLPVGSGLLIPQLQHDKTTP